MQTEEIDPAEKALEKEFSDYLASVSREVIAPISANIKRHQADVEQMLTKVAEARSGVESEFGRQREYLNTVRQQIDVIVKESELKIARLHSLFQTLLDNSRQRIVAEMTTISGQVENTARKIEDENAKTSGAIYDHHQALRRLTEEHRETTTKLLDDVQVALNRAFEIHRASLNETVVELLHGFDAIALDVKQTTERLWLVHDETRTRLFAEFSSFKDSVFAQIGTAHETLRHDISGQVDRKSEDIIKQVGAGITGHYSEQFSVLTNEIHAGLVGINKSSLDQEDRIKDAIINTVGDVTKSLMDEGGRQLGSLEQLQRELASIKKLIGIVIIFAIVTVIFFSKF